jgi:ribosomal-protein-alanine N-acetyltransferase
MIIGAVESNQLIGNNELTLEVRVSNEAAQNLYRKFGFKIVGRRKQYYSDNREDAYIMTASGIDSEEYREMMENLRLTYTQKWGLRPRYLDQLN